MRRFLSTQAFAPQRHGAHLQTAALRNTRTTVARASVARAAVARAAVARGLATNVGVTESDGHHPDAAEAARLTERAYLMPTYTATGARGGGTVFVRGKGATLTDSEGNECLDMAAGIAVNILGHSDEGVAAAVADQARRLQHVSNLYHTEPYARLAAKLSRSAPLLSSRGGGDAGGDGDGDGDGDGARVFFCNSGAEANEAAAKFSTLHAAETEGRGGQGPARRRTNFVAFEGGFHGRTSGALALTHKPAIRAPFANMLMPEDRVRFAPFNDEEAAAALVDDTVAAVFVEPVQGEGGIHPPVINQNSCVCVCAC